MKQTNPITGTITTLGWEDGKLQWKSETPTDAILELNHARRTDGTNGYTPSKDMKHVAHIPNAVYFMLINQKIISEDGLTVDDKKFSKWLNDGDNAYFRTSGGKV